MYIYKGERDALQDGWARYFCTCGDCVEVLERDSDGRYRDYDAELKAFFAGHIECPDDSEFFGEE